MESKITCRLLGHFSLLTRLFSHLLSVMLEALKMDKSPHCAETTHRSEAALYHKVLHIV